MLHALREAHEVLELHQDQVVEVRVEEEQRRAQGAAQGEAEEQVLGSSRSRDQRHQDDAALEGTDVDK